MDWYMPYEKLGDIGVEIYLRRQHDGETLYEIRMGNVDLMEGVVDDVDVEDIDNQRSHDGWDDGWDSGAIFRHVRGLFAKRLLRAIQHAEGTS